ncbi:MAG: cyclic nucleotide-binding domain-containing protein [Verrucomicrobia bacterium]|nr:cyclic nucleotide-binding domain-containing protein [Cytophagales bacterium]
MNFTDIFKKKYTVSELNLLRFFARVPVFASLSVDEMEVFLPFFHLRTYQANEVVFFRNDPSKAFYVVKTGKIILNIDVNNDFEFLRNIKPADSFGNDALLAGTHRHYNAITANEACELYVLPQVNIADIFKHHPNITARVMTSLASIYQRHLDNIFKNYQTSPGIFDLSKTYEED